MPQEENRRGATFSKVPAVFFIIVTFILTYIAWIDVHSVVFHELSTISRYLAWVCGIMLFCDFLHRKITVQAKSEKSRKKGKLAKLVKSIIKKLPLPALNKRDKNEQAEAGLEYSDEIEDNPKDSALGVIPQKAESSEGKGGGDKFKTEKNKKTKLLQFAYVLALAFITVNFVFYIFESYLPSQAYEEFEYNLLHVFLMVGIAVVSLVLKKWFESGKDSVGSASAVSFFAFYGGISLINAFLIALNVMLGFQTVKPIFWVNIVVSLYFALFLSFRLGVSAIKGNLLEDIDYHIYIPFLTQSKEQKLIEVLEESTGLSLKSLWSLKFASTILPAGILGAALILLLASCIYTVNPYEQAVIYRLGEMQEDAIKDSGIHLKAPWPIDKLEIYDVSRVETMTIGYEAGDVRDYLWTESHGAEEYTLLLGNGNELVSINLKLMFSIDDLYSYVTRSSDPQNILRAKAYEILMNKTSTTNLDTFLSVDRANLSESIKAELENFCLESGIGLEVHEVAIESIHPPIDIADTYQAVVSAGIKKTTMITNARASALDMEIKAEHRAKTSVIDAWARQTEKVATASYEMSVYRAAREAYLQNPQSFRLQKYLSTYEKVIDENKVYVFFPNAASDMSDYIINHSNDSNITIIE